MEVAGTALVSAVSTLLCCNPIFAVGAVAAVLVFSACLPQNIPSKKSEYQQILDSISFQYSDKVLLTGPKGVGKSTWLYLNGLGPKPEISEDRFDGTTRDFESGRFIDTIGLPLKDHSFYRFLAVRMYLGIVPSTALLFSTDRSLEMESLVNFLGLKNNQWVLLNGGAVHIALRYITRDKVFNDQIVFVQKPPKGMNAIRRKEEVKDTKNIQNLLSDMLNEARDLIAKLSLQNIAKIAGTTPQLVILTYYKQVRGKCPGKDAECIREYLNPDIIKHKVIADNPIHEPDF